MGGFLSNLKQSVQKSQSTVTTPWRDVNPLVVIGLTEAILGLDLTTDQIYSVIRSYGRQLVAQVHPDRLAENISGDRQAQIFEAFNVLDNQEHFNLALAEFKTLRAEDRRETKILSETVASLRQQVTGLEAEFNKFAKLKSDLAQERQRFEEQKEKEHLVLPDLERTLRADEERIEVLTKTLKGTQEAAALMKRDFESSMQYIINLGRNKKQSGTMLAFEARWVAVASFWHLTSDEPLPVNKEGLTNPDLKEKASSIGISEKRLSEVIQLWKESVEYYGVPYKTEKTRFPLGFSLVQLNTGIPRVTFGDSLTANGGRVIGSLPADKFTVTREQLGKSISYSRTLAALDPLLVPGGILVSIQSLRGNQKASWSQTCPAFRFTTRRLIIAVG
jgi:hypothetical protein